MDGVRASQAGPGGVAICSTGPAPEQPPPPPHLTDPGTSPLEDLPIAGDQKYQCEHLASSPESSLKYEDHFTLWASQPSCGGWTADSRTSPLWDLPLLCSLLLPHSPATHSNSQETLSAVISIPASPSSPSSVCPL